MITNTPFFSVLYKAVVKIVLLSSAIATAVAEVNFKTEAGVRSSAAPLS